MLKKLLGIAPKPTTDGTYTPSPVALKLATSPKTDYEAIKFENSYTGNKRILMLCTEENHLMMKNGKKFSTGNHPVEMLVPMLHFNNAGFGVDIITPTGKPVKIEMWAMPKKDENVHSIYEKFKSQFEQPKSLIDFVNQSMETDTEYIALFIPGGHGALLGLPNNKEVSKLLHWWHKKDQYILAICHGPAAFLSANKTDSQTDFIFNGYKIAAFPDSVDDKTPIMGYIPGHLPWKFGARLNKLGVTIVNTKADNTCYADRKLITAASPLAANDFGKLAATTLLKEVNKFN